MLNPESKIYIAGHRGMVGSAIIRKLKTEGSLKRFGRLLISRAAWNLIPASQMEHRENYWMYPGSTNWVGEQK